MSQHIPELRKSYHVVWGLGVAVFILSAIYLVTKPAETPDSLPPEGEWTMETETGFGFVLSLIQDGTAIEGAMSNETGSEKVVGTLRDSAIEFSRLRPENRAPYQKYSGNLFYRNGLPLMEGTFYGIGESRVYSWSAWPAKVVKKQAN